MNGTDQCRHFSKDIFEYAHRGAQIMIQNGWMEEPPQMEERGTQI
ncbi:DUF3231 family protein [Cytobacillus oceanisediminis]|nr:DUF3231 family protein [Cytobacillus oceanisediminis]